MSSYGRMTEVSSWYDVVNGGGCSECGCLAL